MAASKSWPFGTSAGPFCEHYCGALRWRLRMSWIIELVFDKAALAQSYCPAFANMHHHLMTASSSSASFNNLIITLGLRSHSIILLFFHLFSISWMQPLRRWASTNLAFAAAKKSLTAPRTKRLCKMCVAYSRTIVQTSWEQVTHNLTKPRPYRRKHISRLAVHRREKWLWLASSLTCRCRKRPTVWSASKKTNTRRV